MNNINILFDGMKIPEDFVGCLENVIYDDNQIVMKYGNKIVTNFVGFIEIEHNNTEYRFFSFPKYYKINNVKDDIKKIISTIEASLKNCGTDDDGFYVAHFKAFNSIVNYYNEYGLYTQKCKSNAVKRVGKIKFKTTIKKITPFYDDETFVYDRYIVTNKQISTTLITDSMAYILEEGSGKYDFYFNPISTSYFYDKSIFKNKKLILSQLYKIRINVFKDEEKKLVDNIIQYFTNSSLNSSYTSFICTTNYEIVYEYMVHSALSKIEGSKFAKTNFYVNGGVKGTYFTPDHLDVKNKVIADSKYYANDINNDYKQLFYLQHIANKFIDNNDYKERLIEINKWVNFLIIPHKKYECKQLVKRNSIDGLSLFTLYIDINDLIDGNNGTSNQIVIELVIAIKKMRKLNREN